MDTAGQASMNDRKIESALDRAAQDLSAARQGLRIELERYLQAAAEGPKRQVLIRPTGRVA